jgi:hypothetical protein
MIAPATCMPTSSIAGDSVAKPDSRQEIDLQPGPHQGTQRARSNIARRRKATNSAKSAPNAATDRDHVVGHIEDALLGDRPVEKPELISFPCEPTRREIAALSVIVGRCASPRERVQCAIAAFAAPQWANRLYPFDLPPV